MDIILQEINNYFRSEQTVYKFEGNICELQDVIRVPMPMLTVYDVIYFTVNEIEIPKDDSRFSIYRAGTV